MEELKLTFVNVGYGEAALLECPDPAFPGGTFVMVIDGGSAEAEEYRDSATGRIPLDQYLSLRGVDHIDLMAATHVHEDHLCGLLPAAEKLPPAALWQTLPPEFCRSMRTLDIPAEGLTPSRSKFLRALNDYRRLCLGQSCPRHRPLAGMELRLCRDLLVRVLGPSRAQAEKLASSCRALYEEADPSAFWQRLDQLDAAMNNYSLILLLEYRGTRILLPGDTNHMGYGGLDPASLRADLFKVGHHGSDTSTTLDLIGWFAPQVAVIEVGAGNDYGLPSQETLDELAYWGVQTWRTDVDGTVAVQSDGATATAWAIDTGATQPLDPAVVATYPTEADLAQMPAESEPAPVEEVPAVQEPVGVTVYVTETGNKYHGGGCRYLKSSKIPIDRDAAIAQGYAACKVCGGC